MGSGGKMDSYSVDDVAEAGIILQARLIGVLLEKGALSRQDVTTIFVRSASDTEDKPNAEALRAILRNVAGQRWELFGRSDRT
jgi:hypothetical protein